MSAPKRPCGSEAAFRRHHRNRQIPCDLCRRAHAEYEKARWTAKRVAA